MVIGSASQRPHEFAFSKRNLHVVDAVQAQLQQTLRIKLPVFIAIASEPSAVPVMPLIAEPCRNTVAVERPQLFDKSVFLFTLPFGREKDFNGCAANDKLRTIALLAHLRISQGQRVRAFLDLAIDRLRQDATLN